MRKLTDIRKSKKNSRLKEDNETQAMKEGDKVESGKKCNKKKINTHAKQGRVLYSM